MTTPRGGRAAASRGSGAAEPCRQRKAANASSKVPRIRRATSASGSLASAAALEVPLFGGVASRLTLAKEFRVAHHRLARVVRPAVCHVGVVVGDPDHEAGGLHRPPPQPRELSHGPPPPRPGRRSRSRYSEEWPGQRGSG